MDRETKMPSATLPPSMRIKLPYDEKNDAFNFVCKDLQNQAMEFKDVKDNLSNTSARILFQFTGVWITSAGFGCMLKATEVHLDTIKVVNAPAMEVDSDDEGPTATDADLVADVLHAAAPAPAKKPAPVAPAKKAAPAPPVMLSDSEEESEAEEEPAAAPEPEESEEPEEEEEEEREPTPPPPPPKKVVKKTVAKK
jgi:outer membrane biosynthesis protein TonB